MWEIPGRLVPSVNSTCCVQLSLDGPIPTPIKALRLRCRSHMQGISRRTTEACEREVRLSGSARMSGWSLLWATGAHVHAPSEDPQRTWSSNISERLRVC